MVCHLTSREVVLGELKIGTGPDCNRKGDKCNPPVIRRNIDANKDIIVHEDYDPKAQFKHDIALIRMDDAVPLFQEDPNLSAANPICLPWSDDSYAHFIEEGDRVKIAGWGRNTQNPENNNMKYLKQVYVPIANEKCKVEPFNICLLYTSPSPRDKRQARMPSSA